MAIQPFNGSATVDPNITDATVRAYLHARAVSQAHIDDGNDDFDGNLASFTLKGAQDYTLLWGVDSPDRGALVALLGFERLGALIDGHQRGNGAGRPKVVELDVDVLYEIAQIRGAFVSLWKYFDANGYPHLRPLALDMGATDGGR